MFRTRKSRSSRRRRAQPNHVQHLEARLALTGMDMMAAEAPADMMVETDGPEGSGDMMAMAAMTSAMDAMDDGMAMAEMMMMATMGAADMAAAPIPPGQFTPQPQPLVELFQQTPAPVSARSIEPIRSVSDDSSDRFTPINRIAATPIFESSLLPLDYDFAPDFEEPEENDQEDDLDREPGEDMADMDTEKETQGNEEMPAEAGLLPASEGVEETASAESLEAEEESAEARSQTAEAPSGSDSDAVDVASIDSLFATSTEQTAAGTIFGVVAATQLRSPEANRRARKRRRTSELR